MGAMMNELCEFIDDLKLVDSLPEHLRDQALEVIIEKYEERLQQFESDMECQYQMEV